MHIPITMQLMAKISSGVMLSQLPRGLLGIYPVLSSNPQLRGFANTYGSVKEMQVCIQYLESQDIYTVFHYRVQPIFMMPSKFYLIV